MSGKCFTVSVVWILLLSLILTACGGQPQSSKKVDEESKVLNLWHQWGSGTKSEEMIHEAVTLYEKEHPEITIEVHSLSTKTYTTKISMDFLGTAEDVDVFYYQVPSLMNQLVKGGKILSLNEYLSDDTQGRLKEGSLKDTTVDGNVYGLPLYSSVFVLYCNQALFRQLNLELPATSEELLKTGEVLSEKGITPVAVGAQDSWLAGALYESVAVTNVGADTMKAVVNKEVSMTKVPELYETAKQVNSYYGAGIFGHTPLNMTEYDAMDTFFDGKAAMLLDGTWASEYIDVSEMNSEDIAVITFPPSADSNYGGNYVGSMTSGSFLVNKNTELPAESADFTIFLTEYLGSRVYESGSGLACWNADIRNISPTLKKVIALWDGADNYVPAWDTILTKEAAQIHLSECQGLLTDNPDIDGFVAAHEEALKK